MKSIQENKSLMNISIISVVIITIVGMFLRFRNLALRELWGDELASIYPMKDSFSNAIAAARSILQFPGDTVLIYPFFRIFGENKWGLAIPHIIATLIGFYLLYRLSRKYFKTIWGYVITFLIFALNANLVFHAFEIRPYSVLITLGIATFLVMQYLVENKKLSLIKRILINLFIFGVFIFHLYGVLMLAFFYIYNLFCSRKDESIKRLFIRNIKDYYFSLILALPVWFYFACVDKSYLKYTNYSVFEYIHSDLVSLLKGIFGNLIAFRPLYITFLIFPIAFLIPYKNRFKQAVFLITVVLLPIFLILLISIRYQSWFIQRLFVWVMPLFAFFMGWMWDSAIAYTLERRKVLMDNKRKTGVC